MKKTLSNVVKPEGMTSEEWQKRLRMQMAAKEILSVTPRGDEAAYGVFDVRNPKTKSSYKVVYRGNGSRWNYCSCMDFKTNMLGTCKHIEAVRIWLEDRHKRVPVVNPPYTSLYVSYTAGRTIKLRIGSAHWTEISAIAPKWFAEDMTVKPESVQNLYEFITEAGKIDPDFRCYEDVTDYLAEMKDARYRAQYLATIKDIDLDALLKTRLYPYQKDGIRFAFSRGKSIIADEMGLGKTVQAIGTAELMRKAGLVSSVLILCPASLKYQWKKEIERFTDSTAVIVEGLQARRQELYRADAFYKIVSYNAMSNDVRAAGKMYSELVIMDEVQRLKNWNTQISRAARRIQSDYAVVLSGTPLENKLEELYSVMEFVDQYCLGPYYKFIEETTVRDVTGKILSYKNLNLIGERLSARLVRRRKVDVSLQLPERTDQNLFVPMTPQQKEKHDEFRTGVARLVSKWKRMHFLSDKDRKRMLLLLSQMRMVCDSTYILDQETRYDTKIDETMNILQNVIESGDGKVVIFSQWERMTRLVASELDKLGIGYASLNGSVPSEKRKRLIDDFQENPSCRIFISTDTGSTGLNLQVASLVINLDIPWNPAVLEQRVGRIYRIGQKRNIQVVNMISKDSFEERMLSTLGVKSSLFEGIMDRGDDTVILDDSKMEKIMDTVSGYIDESDGGVSAEDGGAFADTEETLRPMPETGQANAGSPSRTESDAVRVNADVLSPDAAEVVPVNVGEPLPEYVDAVQGDLSENQDDARADASRAVDGEAPDAAALIRQGAEFLTNLSETLKSPEATAKLLSTLIHTDAETGKTELRIPLGGSASALSLLELAANAWSLLKR